MDVLKTLAILAGLGLVYNGYVSGKTDVPDNPAPVDPDNPDPSPQPVPQGSIKIISAPDRVPPPPVDPQLNAASSSIRSILAVHPPDALKIGRTFVGWADLIAKDASLKTTQDFQKTLQEAMGILLSRHAMAGKYPLTQPINSTITAAFAAIGLTEGGTLKAAAWTPACSQAASSAFNAIAYQAYMAFADGVRKAEAGLSPADSVGFAPDPTIPDEPSTDQSNASSWRHWQDDKDRIRYTPGGRAYDGASTASHRVSGRRRLPIHS